MRATLQGQAIRLTAETEEEEQLVREISRNRLLITKTSSVGAPPNWLQVEIVGGFDFFELRSAVNQAKDKAGRLLNLLELAK